MKKVLIASYNLGYGGIETSLINLLKNINLNKFEVTLVLEKKEGVFLSDVPSGVKIKEYRVSNNKNVFIRKSINLLKRIKWLVFNYKRYDSSVCYATYSGPCSFLARTASNNKIMFVHSNYLYVYKNDLDKIKEFFYQRKLSCYDKVIFVSNESKEDLVKIFPNIKENAYVINNIVDYNKIIKLSEEKVDMNIDKKNILFVGRLVEESKKISRIIDLANLYKDNSKLEFLIIGDGKDKEKYIKLIKEKKLNNIKLLGAKKNPYPYIKACDILILTSDYEGFPVVYNEAIVLNKPILSTIDVTDDYISINNRFGYIVKSDIIQLKNKLDELLTNKFNTKEKVNFEQLNRKRIETIERLLEK